MIHLAAKIDAEKSFIEKKDYKRVNLDASKNLINIAIKHKIKKFIFASSAATYGEVFDGICSEDNKKKPINPYGKFKLEVEKYLKKNRQFLNSQTLRFFNIAGINKNVFSFFYNRKSVIFLITKSLIKNKPIFFINRPNKNLNDNSTIRDYIHISDICKIILKSINLKKEY